MVKKRQELLCSWQLVVPAPVWINFNFLQCSAQCGSGIQTRKVFCGTFTDEGVEKAEEDKCDTALKYEDTKNCTGEEECKGNWFAGPWSAVSIVKYFTILK